MILYFSGRCCGTYNIPSRPEGILKENANIMMSYRYAKHDDLKRFEAIVKARKQKYKRGNQK